MVQLFYATLALAATLPRARALCIDSGLDLLCLDWELTATDVTL